MTPTQGEKLNELSILTIIKTFWMKAGDNNVLENVLIKETTEQWHLKTKWCIIDEEKLKLGEYFDDTTKIEKDLFLAKK